MLTIASKITYFLSDKFNYDLMIFSDARPNYALAYGWYTQSISSLIDSHASIRILDNRIEPDGPIFANPFFDSNYNFELFEIHKKYLFFCTNY